VWPTQKHTAEEASRGRRERRVHPNPTTSFKGRIRACRGRRGIETMSMPLIRQRLGPSESQSISNWYFRKKGRYDQCMTDRALRQYVFPPRRSRGPETGARRWVITRRTDGERRFFHGEARFCARPDSHSVSASGPGGPPRARAPGSREKAIAKPGWGQAWSADDPLRLPDLRGCRSKCAERWCWQKRAAGNKTAMPTEGGTERTSRTETADGSTRIRHRRC